MATLAAALLGFSPAQSVPACVIVVCRRYMQMTGTICSVIQIDGCSSNELHCAQIVLPDLFTAILMIQEVMQRSVTEGRQQSVTEVPTRMTAHNNVHKQHKQHGDSTTL